MSPLEYAGHTGRSERTVRNWISSRLIPVIRLSQKGGILIDPVKADAALARKYEVTECDLVKTSLPRFTRKKDEV